MAIQTVGQRVREAMKEQGISQYDLADHLGISQPAVSRRIAGRVDFNVAQLRSVAKVLRVPTSTLLGEDTSEDTDS